MNMKDKAYRVALLAALKKRVKEVEDELRADLIADMENVGADKVSAETTSGARVASVSLVKKRSLKIIDDAAFVSWVEQNWPQAIVTRKEVSPAFAEQLLNGARVVDGVAVTEDGEVIAGVAESESEYLSVRFVTDGAIALMEDARERAALDAALMLEGGEAHEA